MLGCRMFLTKRARYREHLVVKAGIFWSNMGLQNRNIVPKTQKDCQECRVADNNWSSFKTN